MSIVNSWIDENNTIIKKWKRYEKLHSTQDVRREFYTECLRLLQKIQGVPADPSHLTLELTLVFNTLVFSQGYAQHFESEERLIQTLARALEAVGCRTHSSEPVALWAVVLKVLDSQVYLPCVHRLVCIQWALWLASCQLEKIHQLLQQVIPIREMTSSQGDLLTDTRDLGLSTEENTSLLVALAAKDLKDILHICTVIAQGVEYMKKKKYPDALLAFQEAKTLPSPRVLLAQTHTLIGCCFAKLAQPQSALHNYRQALEMDFGCHGALFQSSLVYRQLGNLPAEIKALRLLHSALTLKAEEQSVSAPVSLMPPEVLLCREHLSVISQTPPPLHILHTLAHTCVQNDRVSEGVEFYLDLLASLQTDCKQFVASMSNFPLPRIPVIYLEAAFALLRANRFWDAVAVSEEVIAKTADLTPERLILDLPMLEQQLPSNLASSPAIGNQIEAVVERLDCMLWVGAAYFLQGQAYCHLKDSKEAVTSFTRAINLLVKVCIKEKEEESAEGSADHGRLAEQVMVLRRLKGRALAARGVHFADRGQLKEAMRDLQLSLQASPGCKNTHMWMMEVLWQLGRKEEARTHWRKGDNSTETTTTVNPLYLQAYEEDCLCFDENSARTKMENIGQSTGVST